MNGDQDTIVSPQDSAGVADLFDINFIRLASCINKDPAV